MDIQIRKAEPGDADTIAPIMFSAMSDILFYLIGNNNKDQAVSMLAHFIALPANQYAYEHIWIAESPEEGILGQACLYDGAKLDTLRRPVLAYIKARRSDNMPPLEDETSAGEIYLDTIAVTPAARGRGVGQLLLQHIYDFYVIKQGHTVGLLVDTENPQAKNLYLRTGYIYQGQRECFGKQMDHLQIRP